MTLRHALLGVALGVMALTLLACEEPAPYPGPPPPEMEAGPPPPSGPPLYFVNVSSLALREGPTTAAPQISTLAFNDQVEILDMSGGWARVRDVNRGLIGWASMRYLQPVPAAEPRAVPRRRPSAPKEETPKPPEAPTPKPM
jgi:hypothetical protein